MFRKKVFPDLCLVHISTTRSTLTVLLILKQFLSPLSAKEMREVGGNKQCLEFIQVSVAIFWPLSATTRCPKKTNPPDTSLKYRKGKASWQRTEAGLICTRITELYMLLAEFSVPLQVWTWCMTSLGTWFASHPSTQRHNNHLHQFTQQGQSKTLLQSFV